ncbi:AAA family ATPase [Micromonospora lupini]|uniref:helix-turn-helix transcriptional regulator n=1 Tax=Micromonospora lupini TaxID=285679 RepID=UPI002253B90D|nr:LuxR family transcriptional regulator [Micromonospora lupini]MCX5065770.1 AAA family ATPase [Micromonospora lupini]
MELVERGDELEGLHQILEDIQQDRGGGAVLIGPVGSGKTAVLHRFIRTATEANTLPLYAVSSRRERALPLGVIEQLFTQAKVPFTVRDRLLGAFASEAVPPERVGVTPVQLMHDVCQTVIDLAEKQPLVIMVDDAHHCDPISLDCLAYLARRSQNVPVVIVFTTAIQPEPFVFAGLADVLALPYIKRIDIGLLSASGVAQLLGRRLGGRAAAGLADQALWVTGGLPALVEAITLDQSANFPEGELHVGPHFRQAFLQCLYRCEYSMLELARSIAILGSTAARDLVAALIGSGAEMLCAPAAALEQNGLLRDGRFRHPEAEAAVRDSIGHEERKHKYAQAAELLHYGGAPATTVARFLMAAEGSHAVWATTVLREAAEHELAQGDLALGVSFLNRALQLASEPHGRAGTLALLAEAQWRVDPTAASRHLSELLEAGRRGFLTGRQALLPVDWMLWFGLIDEALQALAELNRSAVRPDEDMQAQLGATARRMSAFYPALAPAVEAMGLRQPDPHGATANLELEAGQAFGNVLTTGRAEALDLAEEVLAAAPLNGRTWNAIGAAISALILGDRCRTADTRLAFLIAQSRQQGAVTWTGVLTALRAEAQLRCGDLAGAARLAEQALQDVTATGWGVAVAVPRSVLVHTAVALGDYETALQQINLGVPEATHHGPFGIVHLIARGVYRRSVGQFAAALSDFRTCGELLVAWGMDYPALTAWRVEAARTHLCTGALADARRLAKEQLALLGPEHLRTRGICLQTLAMASPPDARLELLRQSAEALEQAGDQWELARTLVRMSEAFRVAGHGDQAGAHAHRARLLAQECGAPPGALTAGPAAAFEPAPAATAASEDREPAVLLDNDDRDEERTGERPEEVLARLADLSEAERRVWTLAASGLKNRQIADSLYVTPSTVEQHLTRVYRKLRVSRRSDLTWVLNAALRT